MTEWGFRTENGHLINPNGVIFPLTSHETPSGPFQVIRYRFHDWQAGDISYGQALLI